MQPADGAHEAASTTFARNRKVDRATPKSGSTGTPSAIEVIAISAKSIDDLASKHLQFTTWGRREKTIAQRMMIAVFHAHPKNRIGGDQFRLSCQPFRVAAVSVTYIRPLFRWRRSVCAHRNRCGRIRAHQKAFVNSRTCLVSAHAMRRELRGGTAVRVSDRDSDRYACCNHRTFVLIYGRPDGLGIFILFGNIQPVLHLLPEYRRPCRTCSPKMIRSVTRCFKLPAATTCLFAEGT